MTDDAAQIRSRVRVVVQSHKALLFGKHMVRAQLVLDALEDPAAHRTAPAEVTDRAAPAPSLLADLGGQCAAIRSVRGLDVRAAAAEIGISVATLRNLEAGSNPKLATVSKVWAWLARADETERDGPTAADLATRSAFGVS